MAVKSGGIGKFKKCSLLWLNVATHLVLLLLAYCLYFCFKICC